MSTLISFDGLHNVRDLGGMSAAQGRRIRTGMLYRSDQLFFASEGDKAKLDSLGIGKVIDFRSFGEHDEKPDPPLAGVLNLHLPIIEDVRTGITRGSEGNASMLAMIRSGNVSEAHVDHHMQKMYRAFVTEPFANGQYARFIDEAIAEAQQGRAVLWHCTAGKDRAGFATVILLEALGVSRDDIVADYLHTNECLVDTVDDLLGQFADKLPNLKAAGALRRFLLADEGYLRAAYEAIEEHYGSAEAFLERALRVDSAKRETMRDLFLE